MRIEKWEAGAKVEHPCSKPTEMLIIEGEAHDGELCGAFSLAFGPRLPNRHAAPPLLNI